MKEKLEAYLSGLSKSEDEKRKVRKAVTEFMSVLEEHGRTWPDAEDYEAYRLRLTDAGKSEGVIRDSLSRVRKFFEYLADEKGTHCDVSEPHEVTAPTHAPVIDEAIDSADDTKETEREAKTRRFSLLIPPAMYGALEWLSQYDRCSVARVILNACTEYTARRHEDIEYITEQMNILKRGIEQREAGKG